MTEKQAVDKVAKAIEKLLLQYRIRKIEPHEFIQKLIDMKLRN